MRPKRSSERSNSQKNGTEKVAVAATTTASAASEGASPAKKKGRGKAGAGSKSPVVEGGGGGTSPVVGGGVGAGGKSPVVGGGGGGTSPVVGGGGGAGGKSPVLGGGAGSKSPVVGGGASGKSAVVGDSAGGTSPVVGGGVGASGKSPVVGGGKRPVVRDSDGAAAGCKSPVIGRGDDSESEEAAESEDIVANESGPHKQKRLTLEEREQLATVLADFELRKFETFELTAEEEPVTLLKATKGNNKTRLRSVAKIPINDIRVKMLTQICKAIRISGYSRKPLGEMCEAIVAAKLNRLQLAVTEGNAGQQIREEMCPQLNGPPAKRDANKLRLINSIFCSDSNRELYAKFNHQPGKDALTARMPHNQQLFQNLMTTFNDFGGDAGLEMSLHPDLVSSVPLTHVIKFATIDHFKTVHGAIHQEYRAVMTKVVKSGNHGVFSSYTSSIPLNYYAQCLAQFPDIQASFCPVLPEGIARQSTRKASGAGGSSVASSVGSSIGKGPTKRLNKQSPVDGSANEAVILLAQSIQSSAATSEARFKMQERHYEEKAVQRGEERASKVFCRARAQYRLAQKDCHLARTAESEAFKEYTNAIMNVRNASSGCDDLLQLTAQRAERQWKEAEDLLVDAKEVVESAKKEVENAKQFLSLAHEASVPQTHTPCLRRLSPSFTQVLEPALAATRNSNDTSSCTRFNSSSSGSDDESL
jgi:hypothetical protein